MKKEHLLDAVNNISDDYLLDARQPASAKKIAARPLRIAIIAACLCTALIATAAAVTLSRLASTTEPVAVTRPDGTVISYYEVTTPITKLPLSSLSNEARQFAANQMSLPVETEADCWTAGEQFLGLELADAPLLDRLGPVTIRFDGRCDAPTGIDLTLSSYWQGGQPLESMPSVMGEPSTWLLVKVHLSTEAMLSSVNEQHTTAYFQGTEAVTTRTYTTPAGLEATVADVPDDGGYRADFVWNGARYHILVSGTEQDNHTFDVLKQVLDTFQ